MSHQTEAKTKSFIKTIKEIFCSTKMIMMLCLSILMAIPMVIQIISYALFARKPENGISVFKLIKNYMSRFFRSTVYFYLAFLSLFALKFIEIKCIQRSKKNIKNSDATDSFYGVSSFFFSVALFAICGYTGGMAVHYSSELTTRNYFIVCVPLLVVAIYFLGDSLLDSIALCLVLSRFIYLLMEILIIEEHRDIQKLFSFIFRHAPEDVRAAPIENYRSDISFVLFMRDLTAALENNSLTLQNILVCKNMEGYAKAFGNSAMKVVCVSSALLDFKRFTHEQIVAWILRKLLNPAEDLFVYWSIIKLSIEVFTIFVAYTLQDKSQKYFIKGFNITAIYLGVQQVVKIIDSCLRYFSTLRGDAVLDEKLKPGLIAFLEDMRLGDNRCDYNHLNCIIFDSPALQTRVNSLKK
ncbi:hypothetical protein ENBRE01_1386 [Enteropsectra breve]|nr:hypothetical protein ENBRE01_1386 [Enteropsectra breve]